MAFFPFSMIQGDAFFFPSNLYVSLMNPINGYVTIITLDVFYSGFAMSVNDLIPD